MSRVGSYQFANTCTSIFIHAHVQVLVYKTQKVYKQSRMKPSISLMVYVLRCHYNMQACSIKPSCSVYYQYYNTSTILLLKRRGCIFHNYAKDSSSMHCAFRIRCTWEEIISCYQWICNVLRSMQQSTIQPTCINAISGIFDEQAMALLANNVQQSKCNQPITVQQTTCYHSTNMS